MLLNSFLDSSLAHAKPVFTKYKMPPILLEQLKIETEQHRRGDCDQKKQEFTSTNFYAFNDNNLLILIGLPDYFCYSASFMPVTVDSKGKWQFGAVIDSRASEVLTDAAQQLWLVSHFENEAVFPFLHHSTDGVHWQEINLPKPAHIDCCFEYLKHVCVADAQISLKITGVDDKPQEYWRTTISNSLMPTPAWQKLETAQVKKDSQCQTKRLAAGDWQRHVSKNKNEVLFQSAARHIKVVIPRWME